MILFQEEYLELSDIAECFPQTVVSAFVELFSKLPTCFLMDSSRSNSSIPDERIVLEGIFD